LDKINNLDYIKDFGVYVSDDQCQLKWPCEKSGIISLAVYFPSMDFIQTEAYVIRIYTDEPAFKNDKINKILFGNVVDKQSGNLISNAAIIHEFGYSALSETDQTPNYTMYLPESFPESFQITITAKSYLPLCESVHMVQNQEEKNITLVSTQQALKYLVSILKSLSCHPKNTTDSMYYPLKTLDYQNDEKLSIEDAIVLFNLIAN